MKKPLIITLVLASFGASVGAYYDLRHRPTPIRFETGTVTRGDIVSNVICTGALQARETVQLGTQADGIIRELNADFNSLVRRGEVLARLDSSLIQAEIDQGVATIEQAKTDLEALRVTAHEANRQLARTRALFDRQLVTPSDMEDAQVAADAAAADVKAAEDGVARAKAQVDAKRLDLEHTVITSPVDGIVVARDVDVGQTVVSKMAAQTLFEIANDLHKMQVMATVDESDVGSVRTGDPVSFTVEAYPERKYTGTVVQVRENPTIDQNVVSYITVIDVPNPDLTLRPGMTASVAIQAASGRDRLLVPSAALRFKPYEELFSLLRQPVPRGYDKSSASKGTDTRRLWVLSGGRLKLIAVQLGIAGETSTEVASAALRPGDQVVTNAIAGR
jgi:HlyD family secretion protein